MADIAAAREEVQKVVAFLVNRFGFREDVFKHLTLALANLQDDPPPPEPVTGEFVEKTIVVEVPGEMESVTTVTDAEAMLAAKPRRRGRRSKR